MSYAAPSKDTFTGLFPAFAAVTDDQYTFWSAQAVLVTEPAQDCLGDRMDLATMLATAHYLTAQGIGTGAESEMYAQGASMFQRIKSGSIDLDKGTGRPGSVAQSGGNDSMGDWGKTTYGQRLFPMLKACLGGPLLTGTGCAVGNGGFNGFAGPLPPYVDC